MGIPQTIKNIGVLFFARGINIAGSVLIMAVVARYLSVEMYGKYSLVTDVVLMMIPLLKFGFSQILVREIASDKAKAAKDVFTVMLLRAVILLGGSLLAAAIMKGMTIDGDIKYALYLAIISEVLLAFMTLNTDVFIGFERMHYVTVLLTVNRTLMLAATIAVVYFDWGFYSLFISAIFVNLVSVTFGMWLMFRNYVLPRASLDRMRIKFFLKESYIVAIAAFLMEVSFRMDSLFLAMEGYDEVALFGVPLKVISRLMMITVVITEGTLPAISRLAALSRGELIIFLERTFKYINIILLPICVMFTMFPGEIIGPLFGKKFLASAPSMQLLIWVLLFSSIVMFLCNVLIAVKKQGLTVFVILPGIFINMAADFMLIPHWGHAGASFGKVVSFAVMSLIAYFLVAREIGAFHIGASVLKQVFCTMLFAVAVWLTRDISEVFSLVSGGVFYGVSLFAAGALSFKELNGKL